MVNHSVGTIQDLTDGEQAEHTAQYMTRSLGDIQHLAGLMNISTEGRTKAEIVAEIVSRGAHAVTIKPAFNMSGLVIRCAPEAIIK